MPDVKQGTFELNQDAQTWFQYQFGYTDKNGDGEIDKDEVKEAMRCLGAPEGAADAEATKYMARADTDKSGKVSYEEFLNEHREDWKEPGNSMGRTLGMAIIYVKFKDVAGDDNFVTKDELKTASSQVNDANVDEIFSIIDKDGNGQLDLWEYWSIQVFILSDKDAGGTLDEAELAKAAIEYNDPGFGINLAGMAEPGHQRSRDGFASTTPDPMLTAAGTAKFRSCAREAATGLNLVEFLKLLNNEC